MSRSNQSNLVNPAKRFFDWAGKKGEVQYFDKTLGEDGENVTVEMPFKFLVLDRVAQITGGKKVGQGKNKQFIGYWSNAIRDTRTDHLVVRSKDGIVGEGLYEDVKKITGVKFMTGLYIAFYDENKTLQIGYFKIKGSALTAWIESTKGMNVESGVFTLTRGEKVENDDEGFYYVPQFTHSTKVSDDTEAAAVELDVELQAYLKAYFSRGTEQAIAVGGHYDAQTPLAHLNGEPDFPERTGAELEPVDESDLPF